MALGLLVLAVAAFVVYRCMAAGEGYRQELAYSYARSLGDLTEYLEDMESTLDKAKYISTSTGQASVSANLRQAGGGAKAALSYLPFSEDKSAQIEKSISVLSDFALYIGDKSARGEALSPEDYHAFETLSGHVKIIGAAFSEIREKALGGKLSVGETGRLLSKALNLPELPAFDDDFSDMATELSALPTMLYDGPFSDHIEKRQAEYLKGRNQLSEGEAIQKAAKFLNTDPATLGLKYETEGALAAWEIAGEGQVIKITKRGGEVSFFKKDQLVQEAKLGYEEALEKARDILARNGFSNLKESYYVINDNTCTINFAAVQEDVILYPDLIKITLELGEGGMVEFTSTGYLMNHREREALIPGIDESTAAQSVNEKLKIQNIAIALIPTAGKKEVLCYEFTCSGVNDQEVIVYISAQTGLEEQIYIVTESENGKRAE